MKRKIIIFGSITLVLMILVCGGYTLFGTSSALSKENITETVDLADCRMIPGVIGPEDFEYLPQENGLVISSIDRRASEEATGQLYWLDLSQPADAQSIELIATNYPDHFKPHGLTFQPTDDGGRLFVISHPSAEEHTIEVFTLNSTTGEWKHVETLTDELLVSPNDLVAREDGTLFIANDFVNLGGVPALVVDFMLQRKRAPLVYFDGTKFIDLDANVISSAGITAVKNGDREFLYRSDMMNSVVQKLEIRQDQQNIPTVEVVETINLDGGADNFTVDEQGNVYVTTHHSYGLLTDHQADETVLTPTQIYKISPDDDHTLIYANQGEKISAGSVAAMIDDRLFVGQIFNDGILSCPMDR